MRSKFYSYFLGGCHASTFGFTVENGMYASVKLTNHHKQQLVWIFNEKRGKFVQRLVYLLCQIDSLNGQTSICILDDVDLPMEYGQSKIYRKKFKYQWNLVYGFSFCTGLLKWTRRLYSLCSASNRTILLEFVRHRRPYECVVHILPIYYGHRNNNYFQSIYFHIYLYQLKYQFSIHHAWKVKIKSNFIILFEWLLSFDILLYNRTQYTNWKSETHL